jgi:hypothetical protein
VELLRSDGSIMTPTATATSGGAGYDDGDGNGEANGNSIDGDTIEQPNQEPFRYNFLPP